MDGPAVRETHLSILVFLGERVLKFRKPLCFDFADFSAPAARAADCRREVELNRRLAPDVYLGVAEVSLGGETLEHCVVMRRLPAERSLARLVSSEPESVWGVELGKVAATLAAFHVRADRSAPISDAASTEAVARLFEANVTATAPFVGTVLEPGAHAAVVRGVRRYLAGRSPLFSARIVAGQVCDGHGDLQADDIYCLDDGPRILDCLEFDDQLRFGDVAADVAFLAMDLERLGTRSTADLFVRHYEQSAGGRLPPTLLDLYVALRAYVRIKVACLRHQQGDGLAAGQAAQLLALARSHLERARVRLVLIGGLPGSGKSTLAAALGGALGATVLRSDELRPPLDAPAADQSPTAVFGRGRYTPERRQGVYDDLIATAREHLGHGESVVLDASWTDPAHREAARRLAVESSADLTALRCAAPAAVIEERVASRLRRATDPSEATVEVARVMAQAEPAWSWAETIDTVRAPESVLADALRLVLSQGETTGVGAWTNRSTSASGPGNTSPTWPSSDHRTR